MAYVLFLFYRHRFVFPGTTEGVSKSVARISDMACARALSARGACFLVVSRSLEELRPRQVSLHRQRHPIVARLESAANLSPAEALLIHGDLNAWAKFNRPLARTDTPKAFDSLARRNTPGNETDKFKSTLNGLNNLFHPFRVRMSEADCNPACYARLRYFTPSACQSSQLLTANCPPPHCSLEKYSLTLPPFSSKTSKVAFS